VTEIKEAPDTPAIKAAISLGNLKHMLKLVGPAALGKTTIPILSCVRMEQLADGFAIEATDLEIAIRALVPEMSGMEKPTIIPAEKLIAWTKLLTGQDVKLSATDRRATLQCGRSRAVMPIMDVSNWPATSFTLDGAAATLKQGDFLRALRFAQIAISPDESRYTLNGLLVQGDGSTLRLVATDGHRLLLYSMPCSEKIDNLLLPMRLIKVLLSLLSDGDAGMDIAFDANQITATIAGLTPVFVSSRKIQGSFPNWEAVMPRNNNAHVTVKAADLLASLERCMLLSDERSGCVRLTFDEQITIEASSSQNGEASETLDCTGSPKEKLTVGVAGAYLIDLVKKLDGDLVIALPDSNQKAILLKATPHEGHTVDYVVMPMRV